MEKKSHIVVMIPGMAYYQAAQYQVDGECRKDVSVIRIPPSFFPQNSASFDLNDEFCREDFEALVRILKANNAKIAVLGLFPNNSISDDYIAILRILIEKSGVQLIMIPLYRDSVYTDIDIQCIGATEYFNTMIRNKIPIWPRLISRARYSEEWYSPPPPE